MRRLWRIAGREYLAYVRTFGFWLSLLLLPVGLATVVLAPLAVAGSSPAPNVAIVDFSTQNLGGTVARALSARDEAGKPAGTVVAAPGGPFADPADATRRLRPYLTGRRPTPGGGRLDTAIILSNAGNTVAVDVWNRDVANAHVRDVAGAAAGEGLRRSRLEALGVDARALGAIESLAPRITDYSPRAGAGGRVSLKDRLPGLVGLAMGLLLWMVVLTGAGMLLNSVMEEKTSRILEVLLTSASVPEIIGGKIIGVAAVTGSVLAIWMTIAGMVLAARWPGLAADVGALLFAHGRLAYFALYFLGGYLMFATLYVTVGAFCETVREAQILLGAMMILMTIPLMFMTQGIAHPDSPLLAVLTWAPPFTPFLMAARVATDPPAWQIAGTAALMIAVTALELRVAIAAFRTGALAGGRLDAATILRGLRRRGAPRTGRSDVPPQGRDGLA